MAQPLINQTISMELLVGVRANSRKCQYSTKHLKMVIEDLNLGLQIKEQNSIIITFTKQFDSKESARHERNVIETALRAISRNVPYKFVFSSVD